MAAPRSSAAVTPASTKPAPATERPGTSTLRPGHEHDRVPEQQPTSPAPERASENVLEHDDVSETGAERGSSVPPDGCDRESHPGRERGEDGSSSDDAGQSHEAWIVGPQGSAVQDQRGEQGERNRDQGRGRERGDGDDHHRRLGDDDTRATRLPGEHRGHAARRELRSDQSRAERPPDDRQYARTALQQALQAASMKARVVRVDPTVGQALAGDVVREVFAGLDAMGL